MHVAHFSGDLLGINQHLVNISFKWENHLNAFLKKLQDERGGGVLGVKSYLSF